jgi:hypothetical protein
MIVIAYKPGQLANKLFLFAKFLAYGYKYGVLVVNPSFDDCAHYFSITKKQFVPASRGFRGYSSKTLIRFFYKTSFFVGRVLDRLNINMKLISNTYLDWGQHFNLDSDKDLSRKGIHFIQGWGFDAQKLMTSYKADIIQFFQPEINLRNSVQSFFQKIGNSTSLMGVHIRQGDYKVFEDGKYYYEVKDYLCIMKSLKEKHPDLVFLICTNNKSISHSDFDGLHVTIAPGHELLDLYLLAKCNFIMGPPSTYSQWASFYNDVPLYQIKDIKRSVDLKDFKAEL